MSDYMGKYAVLVKHLTHAANTAGTAKGELMVVNSYVDDFKKDGTFDYRAAAKFFKFTSDILDAMLEVRLRASNATDKAKWGDLSVADTASELDKAVVAAFDAIGEASQLQGFARGLIATHASASVIIKHCDALYSTVEKVQALLEDAHTALGNTKGGSGQDIFRFSIGESHDLGRKWQGVVPWLDEIEDLITGRRGPWPPGAAIIVQGGHNANHPAAIRKDYKDALSRWKALMFGLPAFGLDVREAREITAPLQTAYTKLQRIGAELKDAAARLPDSYEKKVQRDIQDRVSLMIRDFERFGDAIEELRQKRPEQK